MGKNDLFNTIMCSYFPDHPSLTWYSHFQNFHHQQHGLPAFCIIQKKHNFCFSLSHLSFGYRPRPKHALEALWALTVLFYRGYLSFCHSALAYMLLRNSGHWQSLSIVAPSSSAIPCWPVLFAVPLLNLPASPPLSISLLIAVAKVTSSQPYFFPHTKNFRSNLFLKSLLMRLGYDMKMNILFFWSSY